MLILFVILFIISLVIPYEHVVINSNANAL